MVFGSGKEHLALPSGSSCRNRVDDLGVQGKFSVFRGEDLGVQGFLRVRVADLVGFQSEAFGDGVSANLAHSQRRSWHLGSRLRIRDEGLVACGIAGSVEWPSSMATHVEDLVGGLANGKILSHGLLSNHLR